MQKSRKQLRKATRKMYYKSFIFRQSNAYYSPSPEVESVSSRDYCRQRHDLTEASYARFVELANSGKYNLRVLDADEGVGWEIFRVGTEKDNRLITVFAEEKSR